MTINKAVKDKNKLNKDICHMIYAEDLPLNLVKNPNFKKTMESTSNFDRGYAPFLYHKDRVTFLKKVERIDKVDWRSTMRSGVRHVAY